MIKTSSLAATVLLLVACSHSASGGPSCATGVCVEGGPPNTCDPTLTCTASLTCVEGELYPTSCGPSNCDKPYGPCTDAAGAPCPVAIANKTACSSPGERCALGCTMCGQGSWQEVIDVFCTCARGTWSCDAITLDCGPNAPGTYEDPACTMLRMSDAGEGGMDAPSDAPSNLDGEPSGDL